MAPRTRFLTLPLLLQFSLGDVCVCPNHVNRRAVGCPRVGSPFARDPDVMAGLVALTILKNVPQNFSRILLGDSLAYPITVVWMNATKPGLDIAVDLIAYIETPNSLPHWRVVDCVLRDICFPDTLSGIF